VYLLIPLFVAALPGCTITGDCPVGTELRDDGACHRLATDTGTGGTDSGTAAGDGGGASPDWTATDVAAALDDALAAGVVQALPVFDAYESYMEQREDRCPSMENPDAEGVTGVWQTDHCETAAGYVFEGFAFYNSECVTPEENDMEPGVGMRSQGLVSQYRLEDPAGNEMEGGGDSSHECRWDTDGSISCFDQIGGSYLAQGTEAWLDAGVESSLFMFHDNDAKGRRTAIDGGVGLPSVDLSFDGLVVDWDQCDGQASGTVAVRDPSGWWFSLVLPGDCSGCGELWLGDDDLGELCVDIAGHLRDTVASWEQPCWE